MIDTNRARMSERSLGLRALMLWVLSALMVVAVLPGCVATETGNPSFKPTSSIEPRTLDGMVLPDDPMMPSPDTMVSVRGGPGTVDPPEGQVWAWNAQVGYGPFVEPVEADGSFSVQLPSDPGELLRVEIRVDGALVSDPFDLVVDDVDGLIPYEPRSPCATVEPKVLVLEPTPGSVGTVSVASSCAAPLARASARLSNTLAPFSVRDEGPLSLEPGERVELEVTATADAVDGILLVPLGNEADDLRAVTVTTAVAR